jgi:hypothetical protein
MLSRNQGTNKHHYRNQKCDNHLKSHIGALFAAQHFLQNRLEEKTLTLISFLLAVCLTLVVVFIIRVVNGPAKKDDIEKR